MLRVLIIKDLWRAWRNPTPWLVFLSMPLLITALIGLAFGGGGGAGLGRIQLAVVDEDDSVLTGMLRGALQQREAGAHLDTLFLDRTEAVRQVTDNRISAALIIPAGFTRDYLLGDQRVQIELIKNPAQSYHPAIVEEVLETLVSLLNALARNLRVDFPDWRLALAREGGPDPREIARLIERSGDRFEAARDYLFPPLIGYQHETRLDETPSSTRAGLNTFAFLLPGLAAMFLLFLADNAVRDLYREWRFRTFERFQTMHHGLLVFVLSKVFFALVILLIGSAIILGGGSALFRFRWEQPFALCLLVTAYGLFAAGFMALLAAVAGRERLADVMNTMVVMGLGLIGGCMFPADQMPAFLRLHVTPYMPTAWFVNAARQLQITDAGSGFLWVVLGFATIGAICVVLATWLFRHRLQRGLRP
jgi:ABC-type multidrug transport system permease subunit